MKTKPAAPIRRLPSWSDRQMAALQSIIDYLHDDEASDFVARPAEEREDHIYHEIAVLSKWLADSKGKD